MTPLFSAGSQAFVRRSAALVAGLALLIAAAAPSFAQDKDPVVAKVNGTEIHQSDLAVAEEEAGQLPPMSPDAKKDYLVQFIADMMVVSKAAEDKKMGDTPNFKARDVDFKAMLNQQVNASAATASTQSVKIAATRGNHFDASSVMDTADGDLLYRTPLQPSVDGNTVDENIEQAQFMENALNWQASFQFLSTKFKGLKDAIRGEL